MSRQSLQTIECIIVGIEPDLSLVRTSLKKTGKDQLSIMRAVSLKSDLVDARRKIRLALKPYGQT